MDEQRIIRKVLDGNIDAYEQLVIRYQVGLIIYCDDFTHDRDAAEDIAQDSFIYAYKTLLPLQTSQRTIFDMAVPDCTRSTGTRPLSKAKNYPMISTHCPTLTVNSIYLGSGASRDTSRRRDAKPPIYRAVIEDYYWHGLKAEAIASKHNTRLTPFALHLRRAKATLKGVLS